MEPFSGTRIKNLFLRQSYIEAWKDYETAIKTGRGFDYVILTASNEAQAAGYRLEIDYRQKKGMLPSRCKYAVLPDPEGKRVGSGGATFHVLKYLAEENRGNVQGCFDGKKILVIHSGGDSKRVPQYSVCGKLFSPVPRQLPNGEASTLFDEFMIAMSSVAGRLSEGMLILSGDVLLLFNSLQLDFQFKGAAAISIKEHVSTGKEHGVFLRGEGGMVEQFLHKKSEEELRRLGAVNDQGNVDLDTGAVLFDSNLLKALVSLISTNGKIDREKYGKFVNEKARISFYGDFLYPLAKKATLEEFYKQMPEGSFCRELTECRTLIWNALSEFEMKVICLSPAQFIHFGTTKELLHLLTDKIGDYEFLGWENCICSNVETDRFASRNSFICEESRIEEGCYVEDSYVGPLSRVEHGALLSGVEIDDIVIPENTVVHLVQLEDGRFAARVYGVEDNPKGTYEDNTSFLDGWMKDVFDFYEVDTDKIWENDEHYLWFARLYPVCHTKQEAVESSLFLVKMARGEAEREEVLRWLQSERTSLFESFDKADIHAVLPFRTGLRNKILVNVFIKKLSSGVYYKDALKIFGAEIPGEALEALVQIAENGDHKTAMRIYYAIGMEDKCFDTIRNQVFESALKNRRKGSGLKILKEEVAVAMPLRVNFGGGWTDTPPYCNEQGGVVLNAAIKLNGILPVQVTVRRLDKPEIRFESADLDVKTVICKTEDIRNCTDPYDHFALHKAALLACGIIPYEKQDNEPQLSRILTSLGGGIYLSTRVVGVPKGSGLGTSSILAGACAKALLDFTGCSVTEGALFDIVLCMEQIMSTGGGWQDQAGGMTNGVKLISSKPGIRQILHLDYIKIPPKAQKELNERFAIVYTGQRRLARNLLREVVGNYIGGRKESVKALADMKKVALKMKEALEKGDIDEFAGLLNRHWELSLQLDKGATNLCIDQIFMVIEDLIDGRFIAGAGGGGFLQIIMKKGVTKEQISRRLAEIFQGTGVSVWDSELIFTEKTY